MKKIVCPRCGVVNLEKFVTFPHCAGCSALLSMAREPQRASIWRRPLRAGLWASLVGLTMAGVMALSFSSPDPGTPKQLAVYAQLPHRVKIDKVLLCRMGLESLHSEENGTDVLREVSWRLSRATLREWRVISVSPPPDLQVSRSGRPAWTYRVWPTDTRWTVRLQPLSKGSRALNISASADEHVPIQWSTDVTVR